MLQIKYLLFDLSKMLQIRVKVQKYIKSQYTCFNMNGALKDNTTVSLEATTFDCVLETVVSWKTQLA